MISMRCRAVTVSFVLIGLTFCSFHKCFSMVVHEKTIFSFLGAPGVGKGTLADQCVRQLDFKTMSTGNLCREEIASGSDRGKMLAEYSMKVGLAPDEIIAEIVEAWLIKNIDNSPIILDGYPRTKTQATMLSELIKHKFPTYNLRIVFLKVSDDEEIVQRIAKRWVCENKKCQAVYNRDLIEDKNKQLCDLCNSKLIRRDDDKEDIVRMRLKGFAIHNKEIISFYENAGIPVETISVSKISPKQVFEEFKKIIGYHSENK